MKIIKDLSLCEFEAWAGAIYTKNFLVDHMDDETIEQAIDDCYPNGLSEIVLNDILWFEGDMIAEWLGYETWDEYEKATLKNDEND